jgi:hypothetical protein
MYLPRGEHTNHYTTDAINIKLEEEMSASIAYICKSLYWTKQQLLIS